MSDEQRTEEWVQARLGKVTASRLADVLATTKSGPSASRKNYMAELICETMTGQPYPHFTSKEMEWGTEQEPFARSAYEAEKGVLVEEVGFIRHPDIEGTGASPDGLVGPDGTLEIKCPNTATHIETMLSGKADSRYYAQMQWALECSGRQWCDFVSFDPRMPEGLQFSCVRVFRDEEFLKNARAEVVKFLAEMEAKVAELRKLGAKNLEPVA